MVVSGAAASTAPGASGAWEAVIGLECHVQLATAAKIFSASATDFGRPPNSLTDPVVLGLPGCLPVLNRQVVELAIRLGLAVGSKIAPRSRFARKHYFYPDLPKGYQISQYDEPLCQGGAIEFALADDEPPRTVRLHRIHLEEDAGKNVHLPGAPISLIDLNRAGVPLVEVVSEPDVRSAAEAAAYMRALRQLVRWLGISDGDLEEGSLRCDANVSIRRPGDAKLGTKAELKNINSFKFVEQAVEHEIARQIALVESGGHVVQETRLWNSDQKTSHSMRSKEAANDYRYFPDPDLPPLVVDEAWIARVRSVLPELPGATRARFQGDLGLSAADARVLCEERGLADWFQSAVDAFAAGGASSTSGAPSAGAGKRLANWLLSELLGELNRAGLTLVQSPVSPASLAALVKLVDAGTISGKIGKDVLAKMVASGDAPDVIVEREGLVQVSDTGAIEAAARSVIAANAKQAEAYRSGKTQLLGFFVGQVMKATAGKANPALVNEVLKKLLA
jgi:aspartyl-tRNA(Asn)/glutamyl-tRNA(Gln) amidotransferase subunit B